MAPRMTMFVVSLSLLGNAPFSACFDADRQRLLQGMLPIFSLISCVALWALHSPASNLNFEIFTTLYPRLQTCVVWTTHTRCTHSDKHATLVKHGIIHFYNRADAPPEYCARIVNESRLYDRRCMSETKVQRKFRLLITGVTYMCVRNQIYLHAQEANSKLSV